MIKNRIKKILGSRATIFVSHLLNKNYSPMKLRARVLPDCAYSDFFIYKPNYFKNIFKAENSLAIINKKPINVTHKFKFFTSKGLKFDEFCFKSSDYFVNIEFPRFQTNEDYLSFTHEIKTLNDSQLIKNLFGWRSLISLQHRGYTIYQKRKNSLGSSAHGNFGFINTRNKYHNGAFQSKLDFLYTPSYAFDKDSKYNLVFNNPTEKLLKIKFIFNNNESIHNHKTLFLEPMGTNFIEFKDYSGIITFVSRLPVCRALIFKNPEIDAKDFDVLHS